MYDLAVDYIPDIGWTSSINTWRYLDDTTNYPVYTSYLR